MAASTADEFSVDGRIVTIDNPGHAASAPDMWLAVVFKQLDQSRNYSREVREIVAGMGASRGPWSDGDVEAWMHEFMRRLDRGGVPIMAHVGAYDGNGVAHVYEIMDGDAWRINVDADGRECYNVALLERNHRAIRLLRRMRFDNGGTEETVEQADLHPELYSVEKAADTCRALITTGRWLDNPDGRLFAEGARIETVVVRPGEVTVVTDEMNRD